MRLFKFLFLISAIFIFGCSTLKHPARTIASTDTKMEYVDICNRQGECRKFSRLIMGTDHLAQANWTKDGQPEMPEEQIQEVLDEAAKLGINFFDTSPIYVGDIEYKLGRWETSRKQEILKDEWYYDKGFNPDRKLYTLSKGGFPFDLYYSKKLDPGQHSDPLKEELRNRGILDPAAIPLPDGSIQLSQVPPGTYASRLYGDEEQIRKRVADEFKHTLNNLNGNVTIYLMHRDDGDFIEFERIQRNQTPVTTIMRALSADEIASNYWMVGWSNWQAHRVQESIRLSNENQNLTKPTLNSPYFSLFEMSGKTIHAGGVQATHKEMMDPNFQRGIKLMPYSPLGGFSIFDKPEPRWENAKIAAKAKFDQRDPYWQNVYSSIFTEANKARYERVVGFTAKFNKTNKTNYSIDQMINAYALAHKRADFLTIGPTSVEQLRRTVGALKLSHMLTDENLEFLYDGTP